MKSHVYLESMSPDGKPGEVKEIVYEDTGPQQFAEPVSYAANDDLGKLRHEVHKAQAALRLAKSKGAGVAQAQSALDAAKQAMDSAHRGQQNQRDQQRTGIDYGAPSPFSRQSGDTRQFMEPVDYSAVNDTDTDSSGATFDDEADDELEAKIRAAVDALEQAQSKGASPAKMEKLAAALKVLRDQLPNPSAPPAETTAAPPRRSSVPEDWPGSRPAGQAAAIPGSNPNPKPSGKLKGWDKHLADLDKRLAARALAAAYPSPKGASSPQSLSAAAHAQNVCCEGAYKCARCRAKAAA